MCAEKPEAKAKLDRLIEAMERLTVVLCGVSPPQSISSAATTTRVLMDGGRDT